jgi:hemoglobin
MSNQPTLFEAIGGHAAVGAAVEEFYRRVLADPDLTPFFGGVPLQRLKAHQAAFFAQALRGPGRYTGRSMREAHAGLGITDAHFDRVAHHLVETLATLGVDQGIIEQVISAVAPLRSEVVTPSNSASAA